MSGTPCKRLPGDDRHGAIALAEGADLEGAIGVGQLVDELIERDAIERQALGIGLDPDLIGAAADDVAHADIIDLGQLVLQAPRRPDRGRCRSIPPPARAWRKA